MADDSKKSGVLNPGIIGLIILALVAVVVLIVVLAVRPGQGTAIKGGAAPVEAPAPAPAEEPVPAVKAPAAETPTSVTDGEWTLARLEEVVKDNSPVYFVKDSVRYLPGELDKIVRMTEAMSHFGDLHLRFRGHTAAFSRDEFRFALSRARAEVVRWAFEYRVGYDLTSVTVQGAGSTELVSTGDSEAARAPNRRVEVVLQHAVPK